jgi:DNA segregation ATPase FtsK/SpoIIIE-like protein
MNIDKKNTEAEPNTDITDFVNAVLDAFKDVRKKMGKEPKKIEVDFDRLVQRFREAGINAKYRQE